MELIEYKNHFITYQRQGNDVNGNVVYLINIFYHYANLDGVYTHWRNINWKFNKRLDKHGNIRIKSYDIEQDIKDMMGE